MNRYCRLRQMLGPMTRRAETLGDNELRDEGVSRGESRSERRRGERRGATSEGHGKNSERWP